MERKTLVLGLGNTLLGDEGAGVYAVRALQEQYADRADVEFLDGGTLSSPSPDRSKTRTA